MKTHFAAPVVSHCLFVAIAAFFDRRADQDVIAIAGMPAMLFNMCGNVCNVR